jgi:hypothetical protein
VPGDYFYEAWIMMLPIFCGQHYSYFYETETSHYLLLDKENLAEVYLQGDDARIFQDEMAQIDNFPEPEYPTGFLTEQNIGQYF